AAVMVLRKQRTEDGRPRTDENRADAEGQMTSETNPSVLRPPSPVLRLRDRAEADESVIGAPIGRAPHVGEREAQIDQPVLVERERRAIERLQERAGNHV